MKQNLIAFLISAGILIFAGSVYFLSKTDPDFTSDIKILKTWELPYILKEISGISHINNSRIACVQDEDGVIFIYDLELKKITKEIKFGPKGDYESVRIIGSTAFVMESSGKVFKILNFESDTRQVEIFETDFSSFNDIESFDYNRKTENFLTIPKENNLSKDNQEIVIYKLDSENFNLYTDQFTALSDQDSVFNNKYPGLINHKFLVSELAIHPQTGEIFILDSKHPRLLILNSDGSAKKLYMLNPEDFQQPEGLSFDTKGRLYISNEKNNSLKQNLHLVEWK